MRYLTCARRLRRRPRRRKQSACRALPALCQASSGRSGRALSDLWIPASRANRPYAGKKSYTSTRFSISGCQSGSSSAIMRSVSNCADSAPDTLNRPLLVACFHVPLLNVLPLPLKSLLAYETHPRGNACSQLTPLLIESQMLFAPVSNALYHPLVPMLFRARSL